MKTFGIIFSNIYDSKFGELTDLRSAASLPFGGRYRQIDFILSNMSNSGIFKIGILTNYNYRSLMDHLGTCSAWDLNKKNEGVTFYPPFSREDAGIYKGKMEALNSVLPDLETQTQYDTVLLSDSTVLSNIDFRPALESHKRTGADITFIANKECGDKRHPLIIDLDKNNTVKKIRLDSPPGPESVCGMGVFIVNRSLLVDIIINARAEGLSHFERDFIQKKFNDGELKVNVHEFHGVVLRNEDIISFYKNNLALLDSETRNGLFGNNAIYTKVRDEAPTYYEKGCDVSDCIVADGCKIAGKVSHSVLFRQVNIAKGAKISNSIIMQGAKIGENVNINYVILDKDVVISDGTELKGTAEHPIVIPKGESLSK